MHTKSNNHVTSVVNCKIISRNHGKALVDEFGFVCGLEALRKHDDFAHTTFSQAGDLDNFDLVKAIQFAIGYLSSSASRTVDPEHKQWLLGELEKACGPLDKPITLIIYEGDMATVPA
ncbi:hypothetical protein [Rugamonas apoptosis]|uniref:Uncharacterized protein n=1 Tax=Rugamonas apoptosis TaxID=2758570 RepID=A0A7W2F7X3_9BURK|nr:hypothetical protein [Rugamonas apoptosis]MBA5686709.1 hypothetical protein [Rugamonas apoptosis]